MVERLKLWEDEEQIKGINELLLKKMWKVERNLWTPSFGTGYAWTCRNADDKINVSECGCMSLNVPRAT
jgi:hypothetical protein